MTSSDLLQLGIAAISLSFRVVLILVGYKICESGAKLLRSNLVRRSDGASLVASLVASILLMFAGLAMILFATIGSVPFTASACTISETVDHLVDPEVF